MNSPRQSPSTPVILPDFASFVGRSEGDFCINKIAFSVGILGKYPKSQVSFQSSFRLGSPSEAAVSWD